MWLSRVSEAPDAIYMHLLHQSRVHDVVLVGAAVHVGAGVSRSSHSLLGLPRFVTVRDLLEWVINTPRFVTVRLRPIYSPRYAKAPCHA
jgi:hypothetical protein